MKILLTSAAIAAITFTPTLAYAQFGGFGNNSTAGILTGAGAGAGIGALIAGQGNNVEGALLGAALGGVAGSAFTPQNQGFNGGFGNNRTNSTLIGAGAGAGVGALIAGRGNNVEGALLGAALGGVAGNAFAPRGRNFNGRSASRYAGGPVHGGYPVQGQYAPQYTSGPIYNSAPLYAAPQYVNSGQYIAGPVVPVTRYVQPAVQPVYVQRTVYVQRPAPAPQVQRVIVPAPQMASCPSNTTPQADGTCLDRHVTQYVNPAQQRSTSSRHAPCPSDSVKQADGTCLTSTVTHIDRTAHVTAAPQPTTWVERQHVDTVITHQPTNTYCYQGSSKRYDQWGHDISKGHHNQCHN